MIVVDETSMVSLTMMARLLEAVRPDARLILVGDPDQLASVEAGAVLADLVDGLATRRRPRRAEDVAPVRRVDRRAGVGDPRRRRGPAIEVLRAGGEHIEWIDTDEPAEHLRKVLVPQALRLREAAILGDARRRWRRWTSTGCCARTGAARTACGSGTVRSSGGWPRRPASRSGRPGMPGRPVLVTANDYGLGLYNGDTGVTVRRDGVLRAVIAGTEPLEFATSRLADVDTMHAMTIHKSQGSQADEVTVLLPPEDSRLLTRELFYTAVTRAKQGAGGRREAQLRAAVDRRAVRASGLGRRLRYATAVSSTPTRDRGRLTSRCVAQCG